LPAVIELKQENAKDTPLRMLAEGLAYACAVRKGWNEGKLRTEWLAAMKRNGIQQEPAETLAEVPVLLLAPSDFWKRTIGLPGQRSRGKVREDAWPQFARLVQGCVGHGFPIHAAQFDIEEVEPGSFTVSNVALVALPISKS
jgi:hypothetical protein